MAFPTEDAIGDCSVDAPTTASLQRSCGRVARRDVFARSIGILIMVVTVTVTMVVTAAILVLTMVSALVTVTVRVGGDGPPM